MIEILLGHGSYLLIIVVLVLTGSGLPIPEEVPIVAAGILASHGRLDPHWAMAACLFGALAGDCVMYWIGYHFGRSVLREHPWWAHFVRPEREAQIEQMIAQHGLKVFFLARFLVGLRSPVYLSAGILRVPFRRFLLIDLVCATSVIGLFFMLSYRYGQTITGWIRRAEFGLWGIVILVLLGVGVFYWRRRRRNQRQAELQSQVESADSSASQNHPEEESSEVEHVA
ncbi:MAG TPA: DedA family protein [Thermoguttaceae bacterium]|nr:DedA family protein [Thermoguttaceae bacterium]